MKITKHFTFEASHVLPKHPGKCARLHGHSWKLAVCVEGPIDPRTGFVVDYGELSQLVRDYIVNNLDHTHLGYGEALTEIDPDTRGYWHPYFGEKFYPSSENLCRAIFKLLNPLVQELGTDVRLYSIQIDETCTSSATWSREDELNADYTPSH
jgi:6-pyruvoyltetrahydropterin/6-carboxytetrahydropterin synthase